MSLYCLRQHVGRVFFQAFCQVICQMFCFLLGSAAKLFWTACLSNVFRTCFSWKLTTHLRLSGLCLLPVACVILSSLAARFLQYPLTACYLMVFMVFHDAERSLLLTVAWFSLKGMTAAWFSYVFADSCIVFI